MDLMSCGGGEEEGINTEARGDEEKAARHLTSLEKWYDSSGMTIRITKSPTQNTQFLSHESSSETVRGSREGRTRMRKMSL